MNTQQIATRLTQLCRQGKFEAAQKELFAEDAVSIEPRDTPDFPKETKGLRAIIEKGHKFESMVENIHGISTSAPLVTGNAIALALTMDVTMKGRGRVKMEELCAYEVKDGKIGLGQFFMEVAWDQIRDFVYAAIVRKIPILRISSEASRARRRVAQTHCWTSLKRY